MSYCETTVTLNTLWSANCHPEHSMASQLSTWTLWSANCHPEHSMVSQLSPWTLYGQPTVNL